MVKPTKTEIMSEPRNPPAFPTLKHNPYEQTGMKLRDYFAAKVLQGELASQSEDESWPDSTLDRLSKRCYKIADEMLKERENE